MTHYTYSLASSSDSLCHYGILGMKWGVRRYQNEDGTLTKEGKRRYGISSKYKDKDFVKDIQEFGSGGVKRINRDMRKGSSHTNARVDEIMRQNSLDAAKTIHGTLAAGLITKAAYIPVAKAFTSMAMKNRYIYDTMRVLGPTGASTITLLTSAAIGSAAGIALRKGYDLLGGYDQDSYKKR